MIVTDDLPDPNDQNAYTDEDVRQELRELQALAASIARDQLLLDIITRYYGALLPTLHFSIN